MTQVYENDSIFLAYAKWHYGKGLSELFGVIGNFFWFLTNFFSFKFLFKTLFVPWKRMGERYASIFDFDSFFSAFIVNTLMRGVGFLFKILVMFFGTICFVLLIILSFLAIFFWIFAPVILIGSVVLSVIFFSI